MQCLDRPRAALALTLLLIPFACDRPRERMPGIPGVWDAIAPTGYTLELLPDSTFRLRSDGFEGAGAFTAEDDRLVLIPVGDLATSVPEGFRGTVSGDTLDLCAPNGICTRFERR